MILTPEELIKLTRRRRSDAQKRVLRFLGIEHRPRPDGSLVVLWENVTTLPSGTTGSNITNKEHEPNWSAL